MKEESKKKLPLGSIVTFVLGAISVILAAAFFIMLFAGTAKEKESRELETQIENCIAVCKKNIEGIEIEGVDLAANISDYEENINSAETVLQKSYIALAMTTYVRDIINLNDPRTLYEIAVEAGDPLGEFNEKYHGNIPSYKENANAVDDANRTLAKAQEDYLGIVHESQGLVEYQ